jgi:hypothetical protein
MPQPTLAPLGVILVGNKTLQTQSFEPMSPHVAQPHVQARLYETGCELEQLADLFAAIADQLDTAYDPHHVGSGPASLARVGFDGIVSTLNKLLGAEHACSNCWKGRLAIAAALAEPPPVA